MAMSREIQEACKQKVYVYDEKEERCPHRSVRVNLWRERQFSGFMTRGPKDDERLYQVLMVPSRRAKRYSNRLNTKATSSVARRPSRI